MAPSTQNTSYGSSFRSSRANDNQDIMFEIADNSNLVKKENQHRKLSQTQKHQQNSPDRKRKQKKRKPCQKSNHDNNSGRAQKPRTRHQSRQSDAENGIVTAPPGFLQTGEHASRMSMNSQNHSAYIREGSAPANVMPVNHIPTMQMLANQLEAPIIAGSTPNVAMQQPDAAAAYQTSQCLQNLQAHQASQMQMPLFMSPFQQMQYPQSSPGVQLPAAGAPMLPHQAGPLIGLPTPPPVISGGTPMLQSQAGPLIGLPTPPPIWNTHGLSFMGRQLTPGAPGYEKQPTLSPENEIFSLRAEVKELKSKLNTLQAGTLQKENEALQQQVAQLTMDNVQLRNMLTHTKNEFERLTLEAQQKQNVRQAVINQQQQQSFQSLYTQKMQNISEQNSIPLSPMQMQNQQSFANQQTFVASHELQHNNQNMYLGVTV